MVYSFCFNPHLRKCLLILERGEGRKRERERNTDVREKHRRVAIHTHPDRGPNLQPKHVPWPEIAPMTFQFKGWCSNQWTTPARAGWYILKTPEVILMCIRERELLLIWPNPQPSIFLWKRNWNSQFSSDLFKITWQVFILVVYLVGHTFLY